MTAIDSIKLHRVHMPHSWPHFLLCWLHRCSLFILARKANSFLSITTLIVTGSLRYNYFQPVSVIVIHHVLNMTTVKEVSYESDHAQKGVDRQVHLGLVAMGDTSFMKLSYLFAVELLPAGLVVVFIIRSRPLIEHLLKRAQKAKQALAHDVDSVGESSHDVQS